MLLVINVLAVACGFVVTCFISDVGVSWKIALFNFFKGYCYFIGFIFLIYDIMMIGAQLF